MGGTASRVDEAAIVAQVHGLQKDSSGWPQVIREFLELVPPGTPLRIRCDISLLLTSMPH